ncbi:MAG: hypothetical protein K2K72_05930 [Duncaniella sp.]|nr:hypothetical protein [Duncaniella sp.]
MNYVLSSGKIIENMRGLAAIHILARSGCSPLEPLMCESRRELLESTVRDAFAACVSRLSVPVIELDVERLSLTMAVGRGVPSERLLRLSRTLEQMVAAEAMALWCSLSGLESEAEVCSSQVAGWQVRLKALLAPSPCIRPSWL